jgi:hypothetical protein
MNQDRDKCLPIENNFHLKIEIINEKREINFNKWMERAKDYCALVKWGCKCVRS